MSVNVDNNAAASVTNSATVSGGGEVNTANDTASDPTTINQLADLTITTNHTGSFAQGQTGSTYTIRVTNSGNGDTKGLVTVVDNLPTGLTSTDLSKPPRGVAPKGFTTRAAGNGWTCTLGTLTCTRSDVLSPGLSYPDITLTVDVATNAPASVTNSATVSGGGEVITTNDTANDVTTIVQLADLTVFMSHSGSFTEGDIGTGDAYTITVTNSGSVATSGTVTLVDTLPAGLTSSATKPPPGRPTPTPRSIGVKNATGTGWSCTTLTCTRSDALAPGASYPDITVTVDVSSSSPLSVTNTATVSGGGEIYTVNDTVSDPTTIIGVPDLTVTQSHSGLGFAGSGGSFAITVSNSGGAVTSGTVTVVDSPGANLTVTAISGTNWACVLGTLTCTRSDALAGFSSYSETITVSVNSAVGPETFVSNTATVSGGGETNTSNDSDNHLVVFPPSRPPLAPRVADARDNTNTQ